METINTTLIDNAELATWNTPRSLSELRSFVNNRDAAIDVEDFDF